MTIKSRETEIETGLCLSRHCILLFLRLSGGKKHPIGHYIRRCRPILQRRRLVPHPLLQRLPPQAGPSRCHHPWLGFWRGNEIAGVKCPSPAYSAPPRPRAPPPPSPLTLPRAATGFARGQEVDGWEGIQSGQWIWMNRWG